MKKAYQVIVDVSFPVAIAVEAESAEEATAIGEVQAKQVLRQHMPERTGQQPFSYRFTAREAREIAPPVA